MILVVGATGALGSEICRRLRSRNLPVRGLVRPGSAREAELRSLGVEISSGLIPVDHNVLQFVGRLQQSLRFDITRGCTRLSSSRISLSRVRHSIPRLLFV